MEQVSVQYYHTNRILHGDNNTHINLEIVFHFLFRVGPIYSHLVKMYSILEKKTFLAHLS